MQVIALIAIFIVVEWLGRENQYALEKLALHWKRPLRYLIYYAIIVAMIFLGGSEQEFIYFQF